MSDDGGGRTLVPLSLRASTWRRLVPTDDAYELERERLVLERIAAQRAEWFVEQFLHGRERER